MLNPINCGFFPLTSDSQVANKKIPRGACVLRHSLWLTKRRLPSSESYSAVLGSHHHAVKIRLWEGIERLKVKVAEHDCPDGLDLEKRSQSVPTRFCSQEPRFSRSLETGIQFFRQS